MLETLFGLTKAGTSVRTELLAGLATFLTMAYITIVNPLMLSTEGTGMEFGAVFTATIIASVVGTLIMGLWANWPIALAPGMGLNAFFTFSVIFGQGYTYSQALTAVLVAGIVFVILSVTPARKYIINSIPKSMKYLRSGTEQPSMWLWSLWSICITHQLRAPRSRPTPRFRHDMVGNRLRPGKLQYKEKKRKKERDVK